MFEQESYHQSPSKRAQQMRESGRVGSSFAGTFPGNTRETMHRLPEGGKHELTSGMEYSPDSKAMKAAKFINDAEIEADKREFQLPEPQEPKNEVNEAA